MLDLVTLVAIVAACVSCAAAVFSVLFARRGGDADVKTDLAELAMLVDRMAKAQRREKMARVRASTREPAAETPAQPLDHVPNTKAALRQRLATIGR